MAYRIDRNGSPGSITSDRPRFGGLLPPNLLQTVVAQAQVRQQEATAPIPSVADEQLSIVQLQRKYENQPMGNIPASVRTRLALEVKSRIESYIGLPDAQASGIAWDQTDFGRILFAGGPRPPWNFMIRTPEETKTNLQQVLATFNNVNDPLRRMGISIQHLGFFDTGLAKTLIAGVVVAAGVVTAVIVGSPQPAQAALIGAKAVSGGGADVGAPLVTPTAQQIKATGVAVSGAGAGTGTPAAAGASGLAAFAPALLGAGAGFLALGPIGAVAGGAAGLVLGKKR